MRKGLDRAPGWRFAGVIAAGLLTLGIAHAQPLQLAPTPQTTSSVTVAPEAQKGARQEELEKILSEQKKSTELAAKLKAEIDAIGEDRRKLNAMLLASAATVRDLDRCT